MTSAINNMSASGGTNAEDALDRADGAMADFQIKLVFQVINVNSNSSSSSPMEIQQPFVEPLPEKGTPYDAVGYAADWDITLMKPDKQFEWLGSVKQFKTGDGKATSATDCKSGISANGLCQHQMGMCWPIRTYGVANYSSTSGNDRS